MKHIKRIDEFFGLFKSKVERDLNRFGIKNYTINGDGAIDVNGYVNLGGKKLTKIPFKFGKVTGVFNISDNYLTSLEGCPKEVGNTFFCSYNKLTNLIGGPQEVGLDYLCNGNYIETLEGCAGDIGGKLNCNNNKLTSLDCSSVINGDIYCRDNEFKEEPEFFGICGGKIIWKRAKIISR